MLAYTHETGEAMGGSLRPGNAGANTAADQVEVCEQALAQIACASIEAIELLLRVDTAGATHALLDWAREHRVHYRQRHTYSVTPRLLALAGQLAARLPLVVGGERAVRHLHESTGLDAYLVIPSYGDAIILARAGDDAPALWSLLPATDCARRARRAGERRRSPRRGGARPRVVGHRLRAAHGHPLGIVRSHPRRITGIPLAWGSEWVAVEAITQGSVVEWDPQTYASRWRSVRGIPLVWTGPGQRARILVGAVTLTSTQPHGGSIFDTAERQAPGIRKTDRRGPTRPARQPLGLSICPHPAPKLQDVTSPLDNTNPHGIRVVADRAPLREEARTAFAKGSRKATAGIKSLTQPHRRSTAAATTRAK
jgi:hypothetical protein